MAGTTSCASRRARRMAARADADDLLRRFFGERPGLEAFLMGATRDYHLTQDILQEAAITLVGKADEFDRSRPFGPWLRGIVRIELASALRGRKGEAALLDPDVLESLAPAFDRVFGREGERGKKQEEERAGRRSALADCIRQTNPTARRVLEMRYRDRRDCSEIASAINRTTQAVYAFLKRIKVALRKCVERTLRSRHHIGEGAPRCRARSEHYQ